VIKRVSLRQHDLDQVLRVERFTLLSACSFTGTPFSCSASYMTRVLFCQYKKSTSKLVDFNVSEPDASTLLSFAIQWDLLLNPARESL